MAGALGSSRGIMASCSITVNLQEANQSSARRNNIACTPDHGLLIIVVEESVMDSRTFMSHEVTCSYMLIKLERE